MDAAVVKVRTAGLMQNKIETCTFVSLVRPTIHSVAKAFQKWRNFKTELFENDDITKTI